MANAMLIGNKFWTEMALREVVSQQSVPFAPKETRTADWLAGTSHEEAALRL